MDWRCVISAWIVLAAGCGGGPIVQVGPSTMPALPPVQVGPTTLPAGMVTVEPRAVVVEAGAVELVIEAGAIQVDAPVAAPQLPEVSTTRLATWAGIALLAGVLGYWCNRWLRLAVRKMRLRKEPS